VQVTFTLRKEQCPVVYINNTVIPQSPTAKYLGLANEGTAFNQKKKTDRPKSKTCIGSSEENLPHC
jgi:hypothetical protein